MDPAGLRRVLLALVGTVPLPDLSGLSAVDWDRLDAMAAQHRLRPLLHAAHGGNERVPPEVRTAWRETHRLSAMQAMVAAQDLAQTAALLEGLGHAPIALKGAWLAHHAYRDPALRPMRDIDLLLEPADVVAAYDALRNAGYAEAWASEMSLADAVRLDKHLPALVAPRGTWIELHHRLWEPDGRLDHASPAAAEAAIRERAITGTGGIRYPDPQDTLAHLIVHAVYSHRLDCGPLLLSDIALLLEASPAHWPRFWAEARERGWRDGARLVLELVLRWRPDARIDLSDDSGPPLPAALLDSAADLLLQDLDTRQSAGFAAAALKAGPKGLLRRLTGRRGARGEKEVRRNMDSEGGFVGWALSRGWRSAGQLARSDVRRQSRELARLSQWLDR